MDRLVLGTSQLGMSYGINNKTGKPDFDMACDIVRTAFDQGVTRFDTAQVYGDSEEVLGRILDRFKLKSNIKVYTKLDPKINLFNRVIDGMEARTGIKPYIGAPFDKKILCIKAL